MTKEGWKNVKVLKVEKHIAAEPTSVDWAKERDTKPHNSTVSVRISYRYTLNMLKR